MEDEAIERFEKQLGLKIRALRMEQGLSQEELGLRSDVDRRQIQRLEYGTASGTLRTLLKVAAGLDTDIVSLLASVSNIKSEESS